MKIKRSITPALIALFLFAGCAGKQVTPSAIISDAQKTVAQAKITMTAYLHLERAYETQLRAVSPKFHAYAETIRAHGQEWLRSADTAIDSYIANKDKSALDQGLAAINTAVAQI